MKVAALVLCALLVGSAKAGILDSLKEQFSGVGDLFKNLGNHVADNGKVVLQQMLEQAKQAGNQLLQSTLLKLLEGLGTQAPGKRDLGLIEKLQESQQFLENHFEEAKSQVGDVMEASMEKLKAVAEKLFNLKFLEQENPEEIVQEIEEAVQHQSAVTKMFVEQVFGKLLHSIRPVPDKRFLKDSFQKLVDFFTPHVQSITKVFTDLGNTLKGHAVNFNSLIKGHYSTLKTAMNTIATELKGKLSGHVDDLKMHGANLVGYGKDAYKALLFAVEDILKQTATNAHATGQKVLSETMVNMAKTITDQLVQMVAQGKAGN